MNRQEAIRIVKNNWPNDRLLLSEALEFLIPELQESKGDKIRKMIRGWIYTRPSSFFDNGVSKEETLAWLEKQGEQKPAEWSEEDERMLASFLHKVEVCDLLSNKESVWILKKLKSLKPQPHRKPTEEQLENLLNACNRAYLTSGQLQSLMRLYLKLKSL